MNPKGSSLPVLSAFRILNCLGLGRHEAQAVLQGFRPWFWGWLISQAGVSSIKIAVSCVVNGIREGRNHTSVLDAKSPRRARQGFSAFFGSIVNVTASNSQLFHLRMFQHCEFQQITTHRDLLKNCQHTACSWQCNTPVAANSSIC